jgi:hypothetical protein
VARIRATSASNAHSSLHTRHTRCRRPSRRCTTGRREDRHGPTGRDHCR